MIENEVPVRSGTTAEWADADPSDGSAAPLLGLGEVGIDTTTGEIKVGDGSTAFAALPSRPVVRRGTATLVAGAVTVADTSVTANTVILVTAQSLGTVGTPQALAVTARTPGVSFTITSAGGTDTSVVGYTLTEA